MSKLCKAGSQVKMVILLYVGHGRAAQESTIAAADWMTDRFAGEAAASSPRASVARRPGGSPFLQQAAGRRILAFVIETQSNIIPVPIQVGTEKALSVIDEDSPRYALSIGGAVGARTSNAG
jgi:hypothetical protein